MSGKKLSPPVDAFVRHLDQGYKEPVCPSIDSAPSSICRPLRDGDGPDGYFDWSFEPTPVNPWVAELQKELKVKLPRHFVELYENFRFPAFEAGEIFFGGNTGENSYLHELKPFVLRGDLSPALLERGLVLFGFHSDAGMDPVCFDTKRPCSEGNDYPLVWVDHESILIHDKARVIKDLASSFQSFIQELVGDIS